jgi:hypothetical protein
MFESLPRLTPEARQARRLKNLVDPLAPSIRTPPPPSSPHITSLPSESRRNIFSFVPASEEANLLRTPYHMIFHPFDRPVVYVNFHFHLPSKYRQSYMARCRWRVEPMTRSMRVNRLFYAEVFHTIYSSFAFAFPPSILLGQPPKVWHWFKWMEDFNPRALSTIRHPSVLKEVMGGFDCEYLDFQNPRNNFGCLVDHFKGLASVTQQASFPEDSHGEMRGFDQESGIGLIRAHAQFWRETGVRTVICAHPFCGKRGNAIIAEAQRREGQRQSRPTFYCNWT